MSRSQKKLIGIAVSAVVVLVGVAAFWMFSNSFASRNEILKQARTALANGDATQAQKLAAGLLESEPNLVQALLIAGEACVNLKEPNKALNYYSRLPSDESKAVLDGKFQAARIAAELGDSAEAEKYLREILKYEPDRVDAIESLSFLLRVSGRRWELRPIVVKLLKLKIRRSEILLPLASDRLTINDNEYKLIDHFRSQNEMDPLVLLGQGWELQRLGAHRTAIELFRELTVSHPDLLEAWAQLGISLTVAGSDRDVLAWHDRLPSGADLHPLIWHVRGLWQQQHHQYEAAARCFWEALSRDPHHPAAHYQLSQTLVDLSRPDVAGEFAQRAQMLSTLKMQAESASVIESYIPSLVEQLQSIGRITEAIGWCQTIVDGDRGKRKKWAKETIERLESEFASTLANSDELMLPQFNLAIKFDLTNYPLPDWSKAESLVNDIPSDLKPRSRASFVNMAADAQLSFSYFNGADQKAGGAYMFEFSGGGVGVIDFNNDGWPDIYLTQGCAWPPDPGQRKYLNRLFQNLGDGKFHEVGGWSHTDDIGFGQGVAVGDYNGDGFADLYVANIGRNQLYQNNGDGTFSVVDDDVVRSNSVENCWTVSCVLADLNGDGWPDLYDVNYLGGPEVYTRFCKNRGETIQCYPTDFPAEQDRILTNQGNGAFEDATQESGIVLSDGKGMGIVAADFNETRKLSVMIANDTAANFFLINETTRDGQLTFTDNALLAGLALDTDGFTNSCMGIAAGDANGDGLLDLFVTNFLDEANNFFVQSAGLQFDDQIVRANLFEPGFKFEGWGAQFLDGELDGLPDLIVANGHLENYPSRNPDEKRMPAQYFQNLGDGRFGFAEPKSAGEFFSEIHLGRAVARIDWNRDGREDVCVTYVDAPVALVTNRTKASGHFLAVRLTGVVQSRDAIGATVTVKSGNKQWKRQLVAGDGFSASNERILVFGLGATESLDSVSVVWPSGQQQQHRSPGVDRELMIIEGHTTAFDLRHVK